MRREPEKTVVTGVGVQAPGGNGVDKFWAQLVAGRSALRTISTFDPSAFRSRVAGECDFEADAHGLTHRDQYRMDRVTQLAVASAREAMRDAGLESGTLNPSRTGATMGSAVCAANSLEEAYVVLSDTGKEWEVDPTYATSFLFDHFTPSTLAREIAWDVGAEGPVNVVSSGCTSGIDSLGFAHQVIQDGQADVMLAGASEAAITPLAVACFDALRATTPRTDDPASAARPFDVTRDGFVIAEGAAVLVLESESHARSRGAKIYGQIAGYCSRLNGFHMTGLKPDGREMADAIRTTINQAGLAPSDISYINAHGSGTKQNDVHETGAFKAALGDHAYSVPISSIKSMVGHSLGAIGSIEAVACLLAIRDGVVPPTANLHNPDPMCDLDYVPLVARSVDVRNALTVGSGFGGFQSAMVMSRYES